MNTRKKKKTKKGFQERKCSGSEILYLKFIIARALHGDLARFGFRTNELKAVKRERERERRESPSFRIHTLPCRRRRSNLSFLNFLLISAIRESARGQRPLASTH